MIDNQGLVENVLIINRQRTKADILFIIKALQKHFVFYKLSQNEMYY